MNLSSRPNKFTYPYLINTNGFDVGKLIARLKEEPVRKKTGVPDYDAVFSIDNDATSAVTRAFQERQILHTKITVRGRPSDSFWEAWEKSVLLRKRVCDSDDPAEEVWRQSRAFNYRLATTFMPSYAKAIYDHFGAALVLDPCAGWGDRLLGALTSDCVTTYIGFDPNRRLQQGYADIATACGKTVTSATDVKIQFCDSPQSQSRPQSVIYCEPFETGARRLTTGSVPFIFTSPPFFDYEVYSPSNPRYADWVADFYTPLFREMARICAPGGRIAIYMGDTSSGSLTQFILNIRDVCPELALQPSIGFEGIMSNKVRKIWMFSKDPTPTQH